MPGPSNRPPLFTLSRAATLLAALLAAAPARATIANDLCAPSADPCNVTSPVNVTDGSILDFGERALRVLGRLDVRSGAMTINAGRVEVLTDGELRGRGDSSTSGGDITVNAGVVQISGGIDVSGTPGGEVVITSRGDLNVVGSIEADSLGNEESGGTVTLTGVTLTVAGPVTVLGGRDRSGGDIDMRASASLTVSAAVDASGGAGGSADLAAGIGAGGGDLLILDTGSVLADATFGGEDGGQIDLGTNVAGKVEVRGHLSAVGRGSVDGGGDGGAISLDAAGDGLLTATGDLVANGGSPDGTGGESDLFVGGALGILGKLELRGLGSEADGGDLTADADAGVEIAGSIDLRGAGGLGGGADIDAGGDFEVRSNAEVDASTSVSGLGGTLSLASDALLTVEGTLITDGGSSSGGRGGTINFDACEINVLASGMLSSQRAGGSNVLIGRDAMLIAGTLRADAASGRNQLRYPGPAAEPAILGSAHIAPPPLLSADATIAPCQSTPGNTRTPTPTPTATPTPGCPGDCDGNRAVGIDELIRAVTAALAAEPAADCAVDGDGDGVISIDELVTAVAAALDGCG